MGDWLAYYLLFFNYCFMCGNGFVFSWIFLNLYNHILFRSLKYNLQKCKLILKMSFIFYKLGNKIYKN